VERIQVYNLGGVLNQTNPDDWHAAFDAAPLEPAPDFSTWLMREGLKLADSLF